MKFSAFTDKQKSVAERPVINGTAGGLTTKLASSSAEIRGAQKLRYQVFCSEMSAKPGMIARLTGRETDSHDRVCDHLLVTDPSRKSNSGIVATQRLIVSDASKTDPSFYSEAEFSISDLLARHKNKRFMELGRSCVLADYRSKRTMELMWHGTWDYALQKKADVMFGCASFYASNLDEIIQPLAFLVQNAAATNEWQVSSDHNKAIDLASLASLEINSKQSIKSLPTLIKGYLRLGAKFSTTAVQDKDFGTIDVLVVLPIKDINPKYLSYYGESANRHRSAA